MLGAFFSIALPRVATAVKFQSSSNSPPHSPLKIRKMAEQFVGTWNLSESTNFDEYMKEVGVGLLTRKMASALKPQLEIKTDGNHWKLTSVSTFKTTVTEFDLGQEFEETTPDGRVMKSVFTFDNNKLHQEQKAIKSADKSSTFDRYIEGANLIIICKSGTVECKRIYTKA